MLAPPGTPGERRPQGARPGWTARIGRVAPLDADYPAGVPSASQAAVIAWSGLVFAWCAAHRAALPDLHRSWSRRQRRAYVVVLAAAIVAASGSEAAGWNAVYALGMACAIGVQVIVLSRIPRHRP